MGFAHEVATILAYLGCRGNSPIERIEEHFSVTHHKGADGGIMRTLYLVGLHFQAPDARHYRANDLGDWGRWLNIHNLAARIWRLAVAREIS